MTATRAELAALRRPGKAEGLRQLEAEDREALRAAFAARGRESLLI